MGATTKDRPGARIILRVATGATNREVAAARGIHPVTVGEWRGRFAAERVGGLLDEPRPGVPRSISDDRVEAVMIKTLEERPANATQWSTRSMAGSTGKPVRDQSHLAGLGTPATPGRVHQVVPGPTRHRRGARRRWSLPRSARARRGARRGREVKSRRSIALRRSLHYYRAGPARHRHDDVRAGTTSLVAAQNVVAGAVTSSTHRRHRAVEFKKFLQRIDDEVPSELAVHLVLDNSATHKTPAISRIWLVARPRLHPHFTPPSSAWLNLVERFFSEPTTTKIRRGTHRSVVSLERDIRAWIATWTENPRPDVWVTTADEILEFLARYCQRISDSRH